MSSITTKKRRARTCDVAFVYRMGAGFPGEINRTHPFSVMPALQQAANPVDGYGRAVLYHTDGAARKILSTDTAVTKIHGVSVRPYPTQQHSASGFGAPATFGAATPPTTGVIDVLEDGYIMVPIVGTPVRGGAVHLWIAVASGSHVQGGFEAAATGGSTVALTNAYFVGGVDASGFGEIQVFRA